MNIIRLIAGSIFLADLLWWWLADRSLRRAKCATLWRGMLALFMSLQIGGLLAMWLTRHQPDGASYAMPQVILSAIYVWHFPILPLLIAVWIAPALVYHAGRGVRAVAARFRRAPQPAQAADGGITRRQLILAAAAAVPPLLTFGVAGGALVQLQQFRTRRYMLHLPQLPAALDGLTIAHVSDTHVGPFTKGKVLRRMVEAVNELRADLVLFTGDLINDSLHTLDDGLALLRAFESRHGVYICEGNHDLIESRAGFERRVRASGVPFLLNEAVTLDIRDERVQLLGLRWGTGRERGAWGDERGDTAIRYSMEQLLDWQQRDAFRILLAHHPHAFDFAGDIPLTLTGHTHGGQLMITEEMGFGPAMFRYWSGHYREEDRHLIVSNGIGNWYPLRTRAPAELIHLTLRSGRGPG